MLKEYQSSGHLLTMTGKKCFYYIQKKQSYNITDELLVYYPTSQVAGCRQQVSVRQYCVDVHSKSNNKQTDRWTRLFTHLLYRSNCSDLGIYIQT